MPIEVMQRLDRLASAPRRSRSFLVAEAVAHYIDRETAIVEGIAAGLADMRAGRVVGHSEAMARIDRTIIAIEARNRLTTPRRD